MRSLSFLSGGGEMGERLREFDWESTPLGPADAWPPVLKTLVALMLACAQPMFTGWGDGCTMLYNDAYARLIGHKHPAALGRDLLTVWAEVRAELVPLVTLVFSGQPVHATDIDLMLDRGDGPQEAHFSFSYTPIRDEGRVAGLFCACLETTQQVASERRLAEEREQLVRLFEQAPTFMAMLKGPEHRIELANPGYMRLVGYRPVLGRTVAEALPDAVEQGYLILLDDVYRTGRAFAANGAKYAVRVSPGGPVDERFVDFVYQPITDTNGQVIGIFVEGADVTERTLAEQALRDLNDTLEQRVAAEIANRARAEAALRQSQKMEAVGQLTGGIAHDFNNLLAAISASLEMLDARLRQGRMDTAPRYIEAAQGAARRAAALIHRLLAFSRLQTLDPKPTNVNRLIQGMEELIRRTVGPAMEIKVAGTGEVWPILVDPNQLESALLNLCLNGRDAMPNGGRLTIETANEWLDERSATEREVPPGQYVSLCVTDTGTGMTPGVIARAFDPFFTTKPTGQGTGLGLSMIYGFIRQSGGQVRIGSEVGRGTTICLYLPRHLGEREDMASPAGASLDPSGGGHTVLVVDDEATVLMLVSDMLQDAGYRVVEAADGREAMKTLQSKARIDLLVTDVGLPGGMNGRQVADAARVLRPDLKVLFITGFAENAVLSNGALDAGMQVITKPFAIAHLCQKVREMMGGQG